MALMYPLYLKHKDSVPKLIKERNIDSYSRWDKYFKIKTIERKNDEEESILFYYDDYGFGIFRLWNES